VDPQADPDTAKDLDPGLALMIKYCIILQLRKKNKNYLSLAIHEGRLNYNRILWPSKEDIQKWNGH
jgi:hypothetical protein